MENTITYYLHGDYALFTDPITKIGGEKMSYFIPTYQSLVGITESIYWKPSFRWVIDKIRILNPIRTESKGIRPIKYGGGNDLSYATYLCDVAYIVKAHFEWNTNRMDLADDFNENKHYFVSKRCLEKGGRRDLYLGVRECPAYVEPCEFDEKEGCYDDYGSMEFGLQFHSFSYPDENNENKLYARFWKPKMINGIIEFCRPEDCIVKKEIHNMNKKTFKYGVDFSGFGEEGLLDGYQEGSK